MKESNVKIEYEKLLEKLRIANISTFFKDGKVDKLEIKWIMKQIKEYEEQYPELII